MNAAATGRTLLEKVWDAHLVSPETDDVPATLYIDLHLIHEVTSPQAFTVLRERGLKVRRPDRTIATLDHATPTTVRQPDGTWPGLTDDAARQIAALEQNCRDFGIELCGLDSGRRGIVHVVGPELGLTLPGSTIVCGDSHTSTHGAFGALAFGIGTTQVGHVFSTQCLLQRRPRAMAVRLEGDRQFGVSAKDVALAAVATMGVGGGTGCVLEYTGSAVRGMSMDERMTLCNMAIEAGARAGMVAPDDVTFEFLAQRPRAPQGADFDRAVEGWRRLRTDQEASYDCEVVVDVGALAPQISYGTHPGMVIGIDGVIPEPAGSSEAAALDYMGLRSGGQLIGQPIDVVFIGSCTNARLSDLRRAAAVLRGRRVAAGVRAVIVPGSDQVKADAEAEGLAAVFKAAGAEWREPGCSMCIAMNGDRVEAGQYAVSTSNRNFAGRQGPGSRTLLAGPETAAAAAVAGQVADPRPMLREPAEGVDA